MQLFCTVDHLVISAGVTPVSMFEETFEVDNFSPAMVIIHSQSSLILINILSYENL